MLHTLAHTSSQHFSSVVATQRKGNTLGVNARVLLRSACALRRALHRWTRPCDIQIPNRNSALGRGGVCPARLKTSPRASRRLPNALYYRLCEKINQTPRIVVSPWASHKNQQVAGFKSSRTHISEGWLPILFRSNTSSTFGPLFEEKGP